MKDFCVNVLSVEVFSKKLQAGRRADSYSDPPTSDGEERNIILTMAFVKSSGKAEVAAIPIRMAVPLIHCAFKKRTAVAKGVTQQLNTTQLETPGGRKPSLPQPLAAATTSQKCPPGR